MRVRLALLATLLAAPLAAPALAAPARAAAQFAEDARFQTLANRSLEAFLRRNPVYATQLGDHRFDADLPDISPAGRAADRKLAADTLAALGRIDRARLSRENQIDAILFADQLRYQLFALDTLKDWSWDAVQYAGGAGGALFTLSSREFAPLPVRLRAATGRLEKLPAMLAQTKAALDPARVPAIFATTAAKQNPGLNGLIDGLVAQKAALPAAEAARLATAAAAAKAAVADYQHWLETTLIPNAKGNERIGTALYDRKLALQLNSPLSRAQIRERAIAAIASIRADMYSVSRKLLARRAGAPPMPANPTPAEQQAAIEASFAVVNADTVAPDQVVPFARDRLTAATEFVRTHGLVTIPPATSFNVIDMPEYARGFAVAYADMPGALEKDQRGFYAVMPIPADWTPEQTKSFLREYNKWGINELTNHEAMPGHLLQLALSNRYPSRLRAVFQSNPMAEGWAQYGQDVMADANYLGDDPRYLMAHLKLQLRTAMNAVLDQDFHTAGLTRDAAMTMMTKTAFQEEREAAGKWTRMQLSSTQLPVYFVGYSEWKDLRGQAQKRPGFNLRRFHDEALAHGSPPVRFIRALLFNQPIR